MAGNFTDFWRIVKPSPSKSTYVANNTETAKLYSNFSWYTKIMKGASSRFSKYTQYKNMDSDVFVSRALDTIAEEMTQSNVKTNLLFEIDYQNENNKEVPVSITMTVRAALRHWSDLQKLQTTLYDISRNTVKYGDCFFQKTSDFKKWKYIDPGDIIAISIDEDGVPEHYHVRSGEKNRQGAFGDTTIIPASGVVHFTLSSSMGENGPFGESPLWPCVKAFRHLSLLEDSVIIYRIVRAPERRVFFIDTGNMPPQKVKAYLEAIKNEMRQKRIPNETGGTDKVDSVYNPMCLTLNTKIPLLDGRTVELNQLIAEHEEGKQNWVYSCDPITGANKPGLISWAGVTRKDAETIKITLDNGKEITCTPDHKFPVLGVGFVEAQYLSVDDPLISFETRDKKIGTGSYYEQIFDHETNKWKFTHRMVAEFFKSIRKHQSLTFSPLFLDEEKDTVHHKDYNPKNNHPGNLQWMSKEDHKIYHRFMKKEWWEEIKKDPIKFNEIREKIAEGVTEYYANLPKEEKLKFSLEQSIRLKKCFVDYKLLDNWEQRKEEISKINSASQTKIWAKMTPEKRLETVNKRFGDKNTYSFKNEPMDISRETLNRIVWLIKKYDYNKKEAMNNISQDEEFMMLIKKDNENLLGKDKKGVKFSGKLTDKLLHKVYSKFGYKNWKHFKQSSEVFNHRIVKIEKMDQRVDTGCITVDGDNKYHDHHTFALEAGVFTKNSQQEDFFFSQSANGRGSRVETLPGGENLGSIDDMIYFQNKFLQGLRIPSSYMRGGSEGIAVADGKVGVAYIEEVRFANYVSRLQSKINSMFDQQFKSYLKSAGIKIDDHLFKIRLCDPANFKEYKQAEVDEKMISNFSNVKDVPYLSARYKLIHYLGFSEDDIQENATMLMQELNIPENGIDEKLNALRMIYDPKWIEGKPDIKVAETYDDHTATTGGVEAGGEADAAPESETVGKEEVASSGKEAKTEPETSSSEKPESKSAEDLKKEISK